MANNYWIKLYHEILHDRKMATLSDHLYRRCIELFLLAGEANEDGALPAAADIAWELRADEQQVNEDLDALEKLGIVDQRKGVWWVTKFSDRQAPLDPEERKARFLERQRKAEYYAAMQKQEQEAREAEQEEQVAGTQMERDVPEIGTQPERGVHRLERKERKELDLQKDLDSDDIRTDSARASTPEPSAASAQPEPLVASVGDVPLGGGDSPPVKEPDIREDISAAVHYWRDVSKARAVHQDDVYNISRAVKTYGLPRVREAMCTESRNLSKALAILQGFTLPQPAEPAMATA